MTISRSSSSERSSEGMLFIMGFVDRKEGHMMKRTIVALMTIFIVAGVASAQQTVTQSTQQPTVITLQNREDAWFYFVLDSSDLSGMTSSSPLLSAKVASFFATQTDEFPFTGIKPRTDLTLEGMGVGQHLLVGFFVQEDKTEFPVRVLTIQVDKTLARRYYELYSTPSLMSVARGIGRLARFGKEPTAAAHTAQAPEPVPQETTLQSFPPTFTPASFSRERKGGFSVHGMSDSEYWNREGTRVSSVQGGRNNSILTLDVVSSSGFSKNISYLFYFFTERRAGTNNSYTLELKPVASSAGGIALLWEKNAALPVSVGAVTVGGSRCIVTMKLAELPSEVSSAMSRTSADFTTCYFDEPNGTYEEFFYATLALSAIPGPTR
jgi:hypothetical protein